MEQTGGLQTRTKEAIHGCVVISGLGLLAGMSLSACQEPQRYQGSHLGHLSTHWET